MGHRIPMLFEYSSDQITVLAGGREYGIPRAMRPVVVAGPVQFVARSRAALVMGRQRATQQAAEADLERIERIFDQCPLHQWGAAAQAAASL